MSYQSFVVVILTLFNTVVALIAGNVTQLGITSPWLTLVVIPALVAAGTLAANQMKSLGSTLPPPNK